MYRSVCVALLQKNYNCSRDEALDIFQTSVIILYDNVISGKLTQLSVDIKSYLMGIAKNKALELIRAKSKNSGLDPYSILANHIVTEQDHSIEEIQLIYAAESLEKLGDPCKSLLQYFYYQKMNMEEIALRMGYKNTDTAKNQKYKCLKRLQVIYSEHINKNAQF